MKIEGYVGICSACFEPVREGEEVKFRDNGSYFHCKCAELKPDSYYLAIERIRGEFEKGTDPTELMNEMERIFKIPMLNDETYNAENEYVIELYREISDERGFVE
jgi:hypothetical protein